MHDFVALDRSLCRVECSKPQPGIYTTFYKPMVLFYYIIEVLTLSKLTGVRQRSVLVERVESQRICGVLVDRDDTRWDRMPRPERLAEEPLRGLGVPCGTQPELDGVPLGIDRAV